jgi:hypothetical protein
MPSASKDFLTQVLYDALAEPVGLLLQVDDFEGTRRGLYAARAAALDPQLSVLAIWPCDLDGGNMMVLKPPSKASTISEAQIAKAP